MRYALGIEYDGTAYSGWQRLSKPTVASSDTVQAVVETALSKVADTPIAVTCAGRTDAGVHAQCQVVHFDSDKHRSLDAWLLGTTSLLPRDVSVRWACEVNADFNARFSAIARRYRYRIFSRAIRPAINRQYVTWMRHSRELDVARMHDAAQSLLGEHDFSAFRSAQCQATHARRDLQRISVRQHDQNEIWIEVQANAFLHHMVRNIVGSLILVGANEQPVQWIAELLKQRDRTLAGPTAPPTGLTFISPLYPARFGLPAEVSVESQCFNHSVAK